MPDVLIVGGGVAGSSLAIALGRAGQRVELFDAATFPREKPCGEGIMPAGVDALRRLGLEDAVGGAPFDGVRYHFGSRVAVGRFPRQNGQSVVGRSQRRHHLDRVLFEAAAATPGVSAHAGTAVDGPLLEHGRVTGVLVNGEPRHAALIVAADGAHSRFRHRLGLDRPPRRKRVGARRHYRLAAGRVAPPWVDIFLGRGYEFYVTPLPHGEILVALLAEAGAITGPIEPTFDRWLAGVPALQPLLAGATPISELLARPLAAFATAGFVPGAVLLGDAAGFLDPITGGGIAQALTASELLAGYVLEHGAVADAWLPAFDRDRRALLRDYRLLTHAVLRLARHPWLAHTALAALSQVPSVFSHLVGVSAGIRSLRHLSSSAPATRAAVPASAPRSHGHPRAGV